MQREWRAAKAWLHRAISEGGQASCFIELPALEIAPEPRTPEKIAAGSEAGDRSRTVCLTLQAYADATLRQRLKLSQVLYANFRSF
ncbi:MAG TPA: hypothetical protein VJ124_22495 [Pyrinomonadaceae bacterium]|nr:hypothetical protein [Pyrinomonadaceae bacterium]